MQQACPFHQLLDDVLDLDAVLAGDVAADLGARLDVPLMPIGTAFSMGTAPDGTPLFDPRIFDTAEFARNPYPYYRILRDHYPVLHDQFHNTYWVTRYDDITRCYFDEEGFNTIPKGMSNGVLGNTQLELSNLMASAAARVRRYYMPVLRPAFHAWKWSDVSLPKLASLMWTLNDWDWSMMTGLGGSETAANGIEARHDLEQYVGGLVESRRSEPGYLLDRTGKVVGKDIITQLCEAEIDGDLLSTEEITSNIALIVGGGGETTRGAILNMWYLLLQHPDQFEAVSNDATLWNAAFHETLRHSSSIGGQPRHNTYDVILHGVRIPAGSLVQMVDFSANHDDRIFVDPERFDIFRPDLHTGKIIRSGVDAGGKHSHMAFGVGPHLCPGAWISNQESVVGSQLLRERLASVSIDTDRMPRDIDGVSLAPIGLGAIRELWLRVELA